MNKYNEDYNKLLLLDVVYNGNNTYTFTPMTDKKSRSLTLGSIVVSGSDDAMRKFCLRMKFKDFDCVPDSMRSMKYIDMVLGIKSGMIKNLWIWNNKWVPSPNKLFLEEQ